MLTTVLEFRTQTQNGSKGMSYEENELQLPFLTSAGCLVSEAMAPPINKHISGNNDGCLGKDVTYIPSSTDKLGQVEGGSNCLRNTAHPLGLACVCVRGYVSGMSMHVCVCCMCVCRCACVSVCV